MNKIAIITELLCKWFGQFTYLVLCLVGIIDTAGVFAYMYIYKRDATELDHMLVIC